MFNSGILARARTEHGAKFGKFAKPIIFLTILECTQLITLQMKSLHAGSFCMFLLFVDFFKINYFKRYFRNTIRFFDVLSDQQMTNININVAFIRERVNHPFLYHRNFHPV